MGGWTCRLRLSFLVTGVEIINTELYHPSYFYSQKLTNNGTHNGRPTFVSGNETIVIRWNVTLGAWTISGKTSQNEEIVRFISRSDVPSPVDVTSWIYLSNGNENETVNAPLIHINGKKFIS